MKKKINHKKKTVHIFIRKSVQSYHHSIERFVKNLTLSIYDKNLEIKIKRCPVSSEGIIKRIYLIIWAFLNQGDVNHITGDVSFISLLLSKKKTINTFLDCRLLTEFSGIKKYLYYFFWFYLPIKKSKFNVFISEFSKKEILDFGKINLNNHIVIPIPLDKSILTLRKNNKNFLTLLIIGTQKNKNIKNMITALVGIKCNLIIVGELDVKVKKILKLNNFIYRNYIDITDTEINKLYQISDILLMVSKYEGFGMPIIEAQKAGLLVITSNIRPLKNLASNYGALLVEPDNNFKINLLLKKIISNKISILPYIRYGKYNSNKYRNYYISAQYKSLYKEI